jgi:hypothetical protein
VAREDLVDRKGWSLLISTPNGSGWFFDEYRRGQRNRDPECESWSSPSWVNPHVDHEVINAEKARIGDEAFRQEYGGEFLGVDLGPCEACGGPDKDNPDRIELPDSEEPARCPECALPVGKDGRCLMNAKDWGGAGLTIDYVLPTGEDAERSMEIFMYSKGQYMKVIRCDPRSEQ